MGVTPGKNVESDSSTKQSVERRPYPIEVKNIISHMKSLVGNFSPDTDKLRPLNQEKTTGINRLLTVVSTLFEDNNTVLPSNLKDVALIDVFWTQIATIARLKPNNFFVQATKQGVEIIKKFTAIPDKIYHSFSHMMKSEYKLAKEDKKHKLDTITGLAGVFDQGITLKSKEGDELEPYQQLKDTLDLSVATYLTQLSQFGGYYLDATQDNLNPAKMQTEAKTLLNKLPELLGKDKFSPEVMKALAPLTGFCQDPNTHLELDSKNKDPKFIAPDLGLTPDLKGLEKIKVRVFNKDCTQYIDASTALISTFTKDELKDFIENMRRSPVGKSAVFDRGSTQKWQPIEKIESDETFTPFLLTVFDKGKEPPNYSRYRASQGKNTLEINLQIANAGNQLTLKSSHPSIDGQAQLAYSSILNAGLETIKDTNPNSTFIQKNSPLYEVAEQPKTVEEVLNKLGLSDIVVGTNYNQSELIDEFEKLNLLYDQGYSDIISKELDASLATITDEKTRKKIRNLMTPRISYIHLLGAILAREGGVANCVAPLLEAQRLQLAMVQGLQGEKDEIFTTLSLNLLEQTLSKFGLPSLGYLTSQTGNFKDLIAQVGDLSAPEIVEISNKLFAQTSDLGDTQLDFFISALSSYNSHLALSIGHTFDKTTGVGHLTARANLTKPSILNKLDLFGEDNTTVKQTQNNNVTQFNTEKLALTMLKDIKSQKGNENLSNYELIQKFIELNNTKGNQFIPTLESILSKALLRKLQSLHQETINTLYQITGKDTGKSPIDLISQRDRLQRS